VLTWTAVVLAACSHTPPVKPESSNVKVSRQAPARDCKDLGVVNGRVKSKSGSFEEAIADMQLDAARLGGNYVQMGLTGGMSQSVNGRAYLCD
jgi:hypothetical protein